MRRLSKRFAGLSPDRFPLIVGYASELLSGDSDQRFHFVIDVFLDGILARQSEPNRRPKRR